MNSKKYKIDGGLIKTQNKNFRVLLDIELKAF